jgi:uncharacterized protein YcbX
VSEASVHALGDERDGRALDNRRFRMTVTVAGVPAFCEDSWAGRTVEVGDSRVRIRGPVRRCAAVQRHPDGDADSDGVDPLRRIKDVRGVGDSEFGRGLNLGVYGEVERPGLVRVGDPVRVQR